MAMKFRGYGLVALAVMAGVMATPVGAQKPDADPEDSEWEFYVKRQTVNQAEQFEGALWVRTQAGKLHVLRAPDWTVNAAVQSDVEAIQVSDNKLYIVKVARAQPAIFVDDADSYDAYEARFPMSWNTSVLVKQGDKFVPFIAAIPMDAPSIDFPVALLMQGKGADTRALLLTKKAIYSATPGAKKWTRTALSLEMSARTYGKMEISGALVNDKYIYVGANHTNRDGTHSFSLDRGVLKIEVATANVTLHKMPGQVTGILIDPTAKDCIIVSTSLVNLAVRRGEIGRLCGGTYTTLFKLLLQPGHGETSVPFASLASNPYDKNSYFAQTRGYVRGPDFIYRFKYGSSEPDDSYLLGDSFLSTETDAQKLSFPVEGTMLIHPNFSRMYIDENWLLGNGKIISWK